jgi:hypothetical protein
MHRDSRGVCAVWVECLASQARVRMLLLVALPFLVMFAAPGTQCTAVGGGQMVTFNPASPGTATPVSIGVDSTAGSAMTDVACPSATQCTAVDQAGRELTFNPASPGTPAPVTLDNGTNLLSVACVSVTQCTTVGYSGFGAGREITFNPQSPGAPTPITIDSGHDLYQVACVAQTQCTALDVGIGGSGGHEVTFDPTAPGKPTPLTIDTATWFFGLACGSATDCVAIDNQGNVIEGDPTSASAWTVTPLDPANLAAVACSPGWCAAVDNGGNAFVGSDGILPIPPVLTGSGPLISGTAMLGQTLTESHGAWSNSSTSYVYQWEQCDSRGLTCSLIAGATSQSFTIQASDVGHTLRVREIAANVAGQGNPALSAPTAVVLAASNVLGTLSVGPLKATGSRIRITIGCTGVQDSRCTATLVANRDRDDPGRQSRGRHRRQTPEAKDAVLGPDIGDDQRGIERVRNALAKPRGKTIARNASPTSRHADHHRGEPYPRPTGHRLSQ